MFSGFWEWLLIIIALVLVFGANNLGSWKILFHNKMSAVKKTALAKKAEIEHKIGSKKDK